MCRNENNFNGDPVSVVTNVTESNNNFLQDALSIENLLRSGVHLGHESRRWNPRMSKYIYARKNGIDIIDVTKTFEQLQKAVNFLVDISSKGNVLILGTKKQASDLVKSAAIQAGAHYINKRWVGGFFSNFKVVSQSIKKLNFLEETFERGVQDRTKYEVMLLKRNWSRLHRLFQGVKSMNSLPMAIIIIDVNYEFPAVVDAKKMGIPIVGVVDTNSDPELVDYVIPANDDSVMSISTILGILSKAILNGNKGKGVHHQIKDYSNVDVKIIKTSDQSVIDQSDTQNFVIISNLEQEAAVEKNTNENKPKISKPKKVSRTKSATKSKSS